MHADFLSVKLLAGRNPVEWDLCNCIICVQANPARSQSAVDLGPSETSLRTPLAGVRHVTPVSDRSVAFNANKH